MKKRTVLPLAALALLGAIALGFVLTSCKNDREAGAENTLCWSDTALWYEGGERLSHIDATLPDVFYLLPTCVSAWQDGQGVTHYNADPTRADHREAWRLSAQLADTIFATRANLFLPYYRQATFGGLEGETSVTAYSVATEDVLAAFDYYLDHYNGGRPFILAGYSQGGLLVKAVLRHISDETYKRLVAAYVVGFGVTAADTVRLEGHQTSHIRLAQDACSCGVTVNFNSVTSAEVRCELLCRDNIGCINPVSWTTASAPATLLASGRQAAAPDARFPYGTAVEPLADNLAVTVRVDTLSHLLVVDNIDPQRYHFAPLQDLFPVGNLHLQELFFYGDHLRQNVLLRCKMFGRE